MTQEHRARRRLLDWTRAWPGFWPEVEVASRDLAGQIPACCHATFESVALALERRPEVRDALYREAQGSPEVLDALLGELCVLANWRMSQGVYRIDPSLYDMLVRTPLDRVPSHVLERLPEWGVYVEMPGFSREGERVHGFFAHRYEIEGRPALHVALDWTDDPTDVLLQHSTLRLDVPLAQTFAVWAEKDAELADVDHSPLLAALNLLIYIAWCNDISGAHGAHGAHGAPGNPRPTKTKRGERIFAASSVRQWDVGQRMGAAIRAALAAADAQDGRAAEGQRERLRPHVRRAHWHSFWVGPSAARCLDVRWLPPIAVNLVDPDALPAVVRPVQLG